MQSASWRRCRSHGGGHLDRCLAGRVPRLPRWSAGWARRRRGQVMSCYGSARVSHDSGAKRAQGLLAALLTVISVRVFRWDAVKPPDRQAAVKVRQPLSKPSVQSTRDLSLC